MRKRAEKAEEVAKGVLAPEAPKQKTASTPKISSPANKTGRAKKSKKKSAPKKPSSAPVAPVATDPTSLSQTPSNKRPSRNPKLRQGSAMKESSVHLPAHGEEVDGNMPSPTPNRKTKIKNAKVSTSSCA